MVTITVLAVLLLAASCLAAPGDRGRRHYDGGLGGYGGGGGGGYGGYGGGHRPSGSHGFGGLPFGGSQSQSYSKSSASASSSSGSFGHGR